MLVSGPANTPKANIYALEGLVETDWAPMSFTMNWKFTVPDLAVLFKAGEAIARSSPVSACYSKDSSLRLSTYEDMPAEERTAYEGLDCQAHGLVQRAAWAE